MARYPVRTLTLVTLLTAGLSVPLAALGQEYPLYVGPLQLDVVSGGADDTVHISGDGFEAGGTVTITLESDAAVLTLTEAKANASGVISADVTLPADVPSGDSEIKATGPAPDGGILVLSANLQLPSEASPDETDGGRNFAPVIFVAVGMAIVLSAALFAVLRRARR